MVGASHLPPHRRYADFSASQPFQSASQPIHHPGPHHQVNHSRQDSKVEGMNISEYNYDKFHPERASYQQPETANGTLPPQNNEDSLHNTQTSLQQRKRTPLHQSNGTLPRQSDTPSHQQASSISPHRVDSANATNGHITEADVPIRAQPVQRKTWTSKRARNTHTRETQAKTVQATKMNDHDSTQAAHFTGIRPDAPHSIPQADTAPKTQPGKKRRSGNRQVNSGQTTHTNGDGSAQANGTQSARTNARVSNHAAHNTNTGQGMSRPASKNKNHQRGRSQTARKKNVPASEKKAPEKNVSEKKPSPWIKDKDLKGDHLLPDGWHKGDQPDANAGDVGNLFWAWEGQPMPPPIWDGRSGFQDSDSAGTIDSWLNKVVEDKNPLGSAVIPIPSSSNFSFVINNPLVPSGRLFFVPSQNDVPVGHIVPRSWIPDILEPGQSLQNFWEQNINEDPRPVHEEDTVDQKPFWERFISPNAAVQLPPQHPDHKGCDCSEGTPDDTLKLRQEKGSEGWTAQYFVNPGRFMRTHCGIKPLSLSPEPVPKASYQPHASFIDDTIVPTIKLFIRSAQHSDVPQIANIYNHYVLNSVCTPEYKAITTADMAERFNSARANDYPFIVACTRSRGGNPGSRDNAEKRDSAKNRYPYTDTVVGFAFADDYHDQRNAMRFTAELGVFASPVHQRTGISKCLMDKMMQLLDTYYTPRGGFDIFDKELGLGNVRVVSRMVINLLYCPEDDQKEWITAHLADFGFEQAGHLDAVGYKLEKTVDLAVFFRKTGVEINAKRPPLVPL